MWGELLVWGVRRLQLTQSLPRACLSIHHHMPALQDRSQALQTVT